MTTNKTKQTDIEEILEKVLEKDIGKHIMDMRLYRRKTRAQMSKVIGVTGQQIKNYENGVNRISVSTLYKMAIFFDVDIIELLPESIRKSVKK